MRISDWSSDVCSSDLQLFSKHPVTKSRCEREHDNSYDDPQKAPRKHRIPVPRFSGEARGSRGYCKRECGKRRWRACGGIGARSEEHTSELQSLMRISYAVFCLKKKKSKTLRNALNIVYKM